MPLNLVCSAEKRTGPVSLDPVLKAPSLGCREIPAGLVWRLDPKAEPEVKTEKVRVENRKSLKLSASQLEP